MNLVCDHIVYWVVIISLIQKCEPGLGSYSPLGTDCQSLIQNCGPDSEGHPLIQTCAPGLWSCSLPESICQPLDSEVFVWFVITVSDIEL